jgi:H+/Cl- antiporter ClcA
MSNSDGMVSMPGIFGGTRRIPASDAILAEPLLQSATEPPTDSGSAQETDAFQISGFHSELQASVGNGALPATGASTTTVKPRIESSTYVEPDSMVYAAALAAKPVGSLRRRPCLRWCFNFAIAVCVALVASLIIAASRYFTSWRLDLLTLLVKLERDGTNPYGTAFCGFIATSCAYALVGAALTAYLAPSAAGSGISEIKCILNGIILPQVLNMKTMVIKVCGLIFAVSSGLPVGREGPIIHTGAIVAAGLTQGRRSLFGFNTSWSIFPEFRNDKEKRDFVACGAAAGVAAAFGAPIGGVLFTIEEGATHWHRALVWRTFFCAVVTTWINFVLLSGVDGNWGAMTSGAMFDFGTFSMGKLSWQSWELVFFVTIGAMGGVIGAAFSALQTRITKVRMRMVPATKPLRRVLEVVAIIALKVGLEFALTFAFSECKDRPKASPNIEASYMSSLQSFYCDPDMYNEMASLWIAPPEDSIKLLFHFAEPLGLGVLASFFSVYILLMVLTYGISVPSGVFIPAILAGSALGRLFGELLHLALPSASIHAGIYSLVGAAAVLGGVTRMTISLAVIILETTGNYEFALPITFALLMSRFVGNWFNEGIYDVHIELRKWPLLPDHIPRALARKLRVRDIMSKNPVSVAEVEQVGVVWDMLHNTTHNTFPVTFSHVSTPGKTCTFAGIITRRELAVLIQRGAFHSSQGVLMHLREQRLSTIMSSVTKASLARFLPQPKLSRAGSKFINNAGLSFVQPSLQTASEGHLELSTGGRVISRQTAEGEQALDAEQVARLLSDNAHGQQQFGSGANLLQYDEFQESYPKMPNIDAITLTEAQRHMYMDLRPYLSRTPYMVHVDSPIARAYELFRLLALRHLCVVEDGNVVGILTRHEFSHEHLVWCAQNLDHQQ